MKKKYFAVGLLVFLSLVGCQKTEDVFYTVTFKQQGVNDIVFKVKSGENLPSIPTPHSKTGYTTTWDTTGFGSVTSDMIINAVETANKYTITYSAEGFAIDQTTATLTYDSPCVALDMSLVRNDAMFLGWKYRDVIYTNSSIWNVADNVTLTASWQEKSQYTVTFIDTDGSSIAKTVFEGETLTDIPTPTPVAGYTSLAWDRTDFTNINENITVNIIKEAKSFVVTLNANGGEVNQNTVNVTYDQSYSLEKPSHDEYRFIAWKYNGQSVELNGTWNIDSESTNIELVAEWGDSDWTDIH